MKTLRNAMIALVIIVAIFFVGISLIYKTNIEAIDKNNTEEIEIDIPSGAVGKDVGKILKDNGLIRNENFFKLYLKLFNKGNFKASTYVLSKSMDIPTMVDIMEKGNDVNKEQVSILFKEGINYRVFARTASSKLDASEEDFYEVLKDEEYIDSLIEKYWFVTKDVKNTNLYYALEGYLYPDTYNFYKSSTPKDVINKMLDAMNKALEPYKEDIEKSKYSAHEILTLASIAEKESYDNATYRRNVISVFNNRLAKGMNLGSDVTTKYGIKLDENRPMTTEEFNSSNPYNTRNPYFTGLPAGPICMVSKGSLDAAINPNETNYVYFISNINTKEMFFFENYSDFQAKKNELSSVNNGY